MLDSPDIDVHLNARFERGQVGEYDHVFYSGPIDAWFEFQCGRLSYRTLDFEVLRDEGDYQGTAVMNYCDEKVPFTRITEHKHFSPWEQHESTVCYREYSRSCGDSDVPYYPIKLAREKSQLNQYIRLVQKERNVTFLGRLGTYRYLDMDVTVKEALEASDVFLRCAETGDSMPALMVKPLG
jgi:UDP-galactopyranose mutase